MSLTKVLYSMITGSPLNVLDFGADPTGVTNSYSAFVAALSASLTGTSPYFSSGRVYVPPGIYYFDNNTLRLSNQVTLYGDGAGQQGGAKKTTLKWAADTVGILCTKGNTGVPGGDATILQGLYLQGGGGVGTTAHGIHMQARMVIRDCSVNNFRGNGVNIVADSGLLTNANGWRMDNVAITNCTGNGLFVDGPDANAGCANLIDATNNNGWGIYDSSFLGNTYVGCHTDGNTLGAYKTDDPNAWSVFLGCYSESSQPASSILNPSMIVNGIHAAGIGLSPSLSSAGVTQGLASNVAFATGNMTIGAGQPDATGIGSTFKDTGGTFVWTWAKTLGRWGYQWAGAAFPRFLMLYDRNATVANGYARNLNTTNGAIGLGEHYVGEYNIMKYRGYATSAPVSGDYIIGDIVWNTSPVAGGTIGFVCTTAGTPGTWKTFGAISA